MKALWFIRLLRPLNLTIIALTMMCMQLLVIQPHLIVMGAAGNVRLEWFDFALLVFSTLMIAGGGYIINDYFDLRTDRINKPERVIIGKYVKRRVSMMMHVFFNTSAVLVGVYLSWKYQTIWPVIIHILSTTLLWFYSLMLKRKFFSGNVLIAFLAWLTPMLVVLTEMDAQAIQGNHELAPCISVPFAENYLFCSAEAYRDWISLVVLVFASFAFATNLIREIIKDMADVIGDEQIGCKTIPIVIGMMNTKFVVNILLAVTIGAISLVGYTYLREMQSLIYLATGVIVPLILCAITVRRATKRSDYLMAGNFLKIAMLTGLGTAFFIFTQLQTT